MSSDSLVQLCTIQESFCHLRALLSYASNDARNESSIYGAVSFILTLFCTSARVTATKFKNFCLGSFPQKDLKKPRLGKNFRAPDFTVLVVQSVFGQQSTDEKINNIGPLIWEVKASREALIWFGEGRSKQPDLIEKFSPHFDQIAAQVVFAKAKFNRKPVYILLSIDIWFILLHFPGDSPSVAWTTGFKSQPQVHPADYRKFYRYIAVPPAPIINENCTGFSPEFLYALQLSFQDLADVTVIPHPSFRAPKGIEEFISKQKQHFSARFEEEGRRAEIENKFALGEEDSDERSARWSTFEEPETDPENQKHPTAVPTTPHHFLTSPATTRSKTAALKSRAVAKASNQPGTSNVAANITAPSRTQGMPVVERPESPGKAGPLRPRRKAAVKTRGSQKKNE